MTGLIVNPGSRVPADADNTYERALTEARRWHEQMRTEGFGHDVALEAPDPVDCLEGRWTFTFRHRVTEVTAELETHGIDTTDRPFPFRQYWRGSSCASPALSDWSAAGYVQTFRSVEGTS